MAFSFGSNPSTQSSAFGAAAKPSFSFGGSNTATTSTAGFGGFGTSTTSSGFGSFGTTAAPSTGFGAGGFGTNTFGTSSGFGAGTSTFGSAAPTFGTNTLGANTLGGNTLGANTLGGSSFGAGTSFGSAFGNRPATTGFGGFGTTGAFGQPQQQQPQQQQQAGPASAQEALVVAVFNCCVFGDERDQVLAKWNLLQAQWGTGKAYYSANAPPLELNEHNPLCRFKAVGYSRLGGREDKDGHVAMLFHKPEQEIKNNQQALTSSILGLLGNKPNLAVNIDSIKAVSENRSQVVMYVSDKAAGNSHVPATELAGFLSAGTAKTALAGAGCPAVTAVVRPAPHVLTQYLQTPPPGMDPRLWKQAQADNPDPDNYIPVPMIGFSELKFRSRCQSEEANLQASWLEKAEETLAELRTKRAAADARITQLAGRLAHLRHTLLQVIARREIVGRVGAPLAPEEEDTRARLHELASQLAAPPLYNGRLNELLCAVRLQRSACAGAPLERYQLDPGAQEDVKQFLALQQRSMAHLMETAKEDLAALNIIAEGMDRLVKT